MRFLTIEDVISVNRILISRYGGEFIGIDNLINRNSLAWVLDTLQYPPFNFDPYPTLGEKSALIGWKIITDHVFYDGNKRTGMFCADLFLDINHFRINATNQEIITTALKIADYHESGITFEDFCAWIKKHLEVRKDMI